MSEPSPRIALHGATGRMGAAMLAVCRAANVPIVGAVAAPGCHEIGMDLGEAHHTQAYGVQITADVPSALLGADVVIDFSHAGAVRSLAKAVGAAGLPLVSGTTGLAPDARAALDELSTRVPVLWAPNFSLGIQVLLEVVRHAARRLGPGFDVEIVEVHHRRKADAPSGTAARLAQEVQAVRPMTLCHGRQGVVGARTGEELGILAVRGGDVVGDHTVHLLGMGERLELTHRATTREVFAHGALFAARALPAKPPGIWHLADLMP
ncbi:MAG: 4-hydroxy-tetrahydrodipicolinate reductase [Deltaproteobacteria bacterium HGW-Deltaproteobacteria-20]|jgi:4-hydroxy-tetrahydrodipicolinate reductase|nr:MAG: 4-hydroxy-tetrahydrodipicolinate reductase [Deltaproteobacteria bacterium HGW-Deltaproteobacteria-20]